VSVSLDPVVVSADPAPRTPDGIAISKHFAVRAVYDVAIADDLRIFQTKHSVIRADRLVRRGMEHLNRLSGGIVVIVIVIVVVSVRVMWRNEGEEFGDGGHSEICLYRF
jgi:hypothetical protein